MADDQKGANDAAKPPEGAQTTDSAAPKSTPDEKSTADGQSGGKDNNQPPTRDEVLTKLRNDAPKLNSVRGAKIIEDVIDRVGGAVTVNLFQGDFSFEGDFVAATGGGRTRGGRRGARTRLDPATLAREFDEYVQPADFDDGLNMLDSNNVLFLSGPAGTGLHTRALAGLVAVLRRNGIELEVFELTGNVLGNMSWRPHRQRCGLLLVDKSRADGKPAADSVTDKWLEYASSTLAEQGCYLTVVTGPIGGTLATAPNRANFVLTDLELPDPMTIVRKRVKGEAPWLTDEEITERIDATQLAEILSGRNDPRFAVRAAAAVADALRSGADLTQAVAQLRDPEAEVREWITAEPEYAELAFVFATAALEGSSYLKVADAAVALYRELNSNTNTMMPRYLRSLAAERSWIEIADRPDDPAGPRVLRFRHADLRTAVLGLTWSEYDGARKKILDWLNKLAADSDVEIRARAAGTAGILAANDFEHGLHKYLLPWAGGSDWLQQSAALGLNVAGSTGDHAEAVWSRIEEWAEYARHQVRGNNLPATAALAAGGRLGVADPRRALRVLRILVCNDDWTFLMYVALSVVTLLGAGRIEPVLDALLDWTDGKTTDDSVVKALTTFGYAVTESAQGAEDRPMLVTAAREHADALSELWGRALDCEPTRQMATDAIETWVRSADTDKSVADDVLFVLAGVAERSTTDFGRVCHALRRWAEDPDDPSDSAADFYNELVEAGEMTA